MTGNIFPDGWTLTGKFISWLTVGEPTGKLFHPWRCCTDRESLKFRWQFSDRREKLKVSLTFLGCHGKSSLTADWKPTLYIFPDSFCRQWIVSDGFPLGKLDFPWRFSADGLSLTVTVTDDLSWRFSVLFLAEETVRKKLSWVVLSLSLSCTNSTLEPIRSS